MNQTASTVFTVRGNQDNRLANPVPYHRATQGSKWNPAHRRYLAWKDWVRAAYFDVVFPNKKISREDYGAAHDMMERQPFTDKNIRGRMVAQIYFGNETHCDPDNVAKGILDALFVNDKHIDVETHHTCNNAEPRVEVYLTFETP